VFTGTGRTPISRSSRPDASAISVRLEAEVA